MVDCSFGHTAKMPEFTVRSAKVSSITDLIVKRFNRFKYHLVVLSKSRKSFHVGIYTVYMLKLN